MGGAPSCRSERTLIVLLSPSQPPVLEAPRHTTIPSLTYAAYSLKKSGEVTDPLQELTGESFGDWLRAAPRTYKGEVKPVGHFGTAYQSIDRPLGEHRDRVARSRGASPPSADP